MASQPYLGAIFIFAGNFAPRGFMLCQGQLLPIAQYTALFSILGTTYGGNGQTTFALPDLQGRAPIGQETGPGLSPAVLGEAGGAENVTILTSNMPAHSHSLNASNQPAGVGDPTGAVLSNSGSVQSSGLPIYLSGSPPNVSLSPQSIGPSGTGLPLSIQNPYLGLNYIIAINGIFPSRN